MKHRKKWAVTALIGALAVGGAISVQAATSSQANLSTSQYYADSGVVGDGNSVKITSDISAISKYNVKVITYGAAAGASFYKLDEVSVSPGGSYSNSKIKGGKSYSYYLELNVAGVHKDCKAKGTIKLN